jgi:RNA polymerase subunit RPABC4/transcription elongation factor Spt4
MLLRAMVYADEAHEVCPFCGKELIKTENGYECGACRTVIGENICPETGAKYYSTAIKNFTRKSRGGEGLYHYRNITPLSDEGATLCPVCGKEH